MYSVEGYLEILIIWKLELNIACQKQRLQKGKKNKKQAMKTVLLGKHISFMMPSFSPPEKPRYELNIFTLRKNTVTVTMFTIINWVYALMKKELVENIILTVYW